ncbi:MAG: hypothetical protein IPL28_23815 [Chloroflexi bacterium]|nr:hypothetical protein [Chloroflexota bacterium]
MADTFNADKFGSFLTIPFSKTNLTTGASNEDLLLGSGSTLFVAPAAGSVVALSSRSAAAITAGTITIKTHAAGTEHTQAAAPTNALSSAAQVHYDTAAPGLVSFAAGDTLGISVTTTTTLDPTNTLDVDGFLFVQFNPF